MGKTIDIAGAIEAGRLATEIIAVVREMRSTQMQHARHFQCMVEEKPRGAQLREWQQMNDQYLRMIQQFEDLLDTKLGELDKVEK